MDTVRELSSNNFRKEDTLRILFCDEKFFDIDGVFNSQNDRLWVVGRADADKKRWYSAETKVYT